MDDYERAEHGIQIRRVAGGYKFSSKPECHEVLRKFVKSLKPPIRLSKPGLETLAVIAYPQPVTFPEIDENCRGDWSRGIPTPLEEKIVGSAGREEAGGLAHLFPAAR